MEADNILLKNQQVTEEIKKEIKICIEMNENENTTTQNKWNTVKAVLRGRFIAIQAYLNGTPLQYSCLENPTDGGPWQAAVHGVAKSQTRLSDFTFSFHFHALEKEMATHSSVLAWKIPGTGEPGGLPSVGLHRVGHD